MNNEPAARDGTELEPFPLRERYAPPEPDVWPQGRLEAPLSQKELREVRDLLNWWRGRTP